MGAEMVAHVIAENLVTDPTGYEEYRRLAGSSVARFGGRFVAAGEVAEQLRGGDFIVSSDERDTADGVWPHGQIVIIEFESAARAREWAASDDYREAKERSVRAVIVTNIIIVEDT
jgi:uncharacterized protein (DUF1330 family)